MDISQHGLDMIKAYESYSPTAYLCPEGVPTIGWGSTRWDAKRPVRLGESCTREQAEGLLLREVRLIEDAIDQAIKPGIHLTQGEFDCLCSWGYNVGIGWITGHGHQQATLIKYINAGQFSKVPGELLKFKKGAISGKSYEGLLNRRKREIAELWLNDTIEAPAAQIEIATEAAKPLPTQSIPATPETAPPQAVTPERNSTVTAIKNSGTAKLSIFGMATTFVLKGYDWVISLFTDTGAHIKTAQESLTGMSALMTYLKLDSVTVAGMIGFACLAVCLVRAVNRGR